MVDAWQPGSGGVVDPDARLRAELEAVGMTDELEQPMSERERALRQLKKRRDFGNHLVAFVVINSAVWIVWALTGSGYPWPAWFTGLWAIGLVMNACDVYFRRPIDEADIRREIERLRHQH
jgi:hypothetical protein